MPPFFYSLVSNQDESNSISSYKDKNELGKLFYESHQSISTITPKSNGGAALDISSLIGSSSSTKGVISQKYTGFETQYYIRLGSLLEFIQNKVLPKYDGKIPVLKFDTESNNYIYIIEHQVSMDPRICLINTNLDTTGEDASYAREGDSYQTTISKVKVGQVMNIYVNFMYILTILDSYSDTKNTTSLIDFLQSILTAISKAIGGINTLEPFIDEETNTVKIIDQTPLNNKNSILEDLKKNKSNSNTTLNLYGYPSTIKETKDSTGKIIKEIIPRGASFVRNFGIKTELSPELASMLTIGAQAAGSVVGMDATGFSKLNQGLEDRVKKTVTDANHVSGSTQTDKLVELNDKYPKANANFTAAAQQLGSIDNGTIPIWDAENIDTYSSLQIDFIQYQEAKTAIKEDKSSASIGFIPINLNLTMDGLSGIKIYNSLNVDTAYLPSNYPDTMDFIIQGVSHKIEGNVWTTSLDTLMVPKNPSQGQPPTNTSGTKSTGKSYTRTKSTINIAKSGIVNKIIRFARSKNITDRDRLIALITIAQAETTIISGLQESFQYSLESAKVLFSDQLVGLSDDKIKKLLPKPYGSGTASKFANKIYGGRFGNRPDEGYKYSGKGLTQITFKSNYEAMAKNLKKHGLQYNLVTNPYLMRTEEVDIASLVIGKLEGQFGNPFKSGVNYSSNAGAIIATQNGGKKIPKQETLDNYQKSLDMVLNTDWILKLIDGA